MTREEVIDKAAHAYLGGMRQHLDASNAQAVATSLGLPDLDAVMPTLEEVKSLMGQTCDHGMNPMGRCKPCMLTYSMAITVRKALAIRGVDIPEDAAEEFAARMTAERLGDA